jgi:RNAse (barnase) inhibitor barstar
MSSTSRPNYASAQAISIRGYIIDTIDALADSLCQKVPSIPMPIRIYCKALYDAKKKQGMRTHQIHKIISEYIIDNWLAKVAFNETVIYGLLKNCSIKQNLH